MKVFHPPRLAVRVVVDVVVAVLAFGCCVSADAPLPQRRLRQTLLRWNLWYCGRDSAVRSVPEQSLLRSQSWRHHVPVWRWDVAAVETGFVSIWWYYP